VCVRACCELQEHRCVSCAKLVRLSVHLSVHVRDVRHTLGQTDRQTVDVLREREREIERETSFTTMIMHQAQFFNDCVRGKVVL